MSIHINRKWMIECQHSFDGKALFTVWLLMIVLGGSIWRLLFCAAIGLGLIIMAAMASVVWFNAEEIFSS